MQGRSRRPHSVYNKPRRGTLEYLEYRRNEAQALEVTAYGVHDPRWSNLPPTKREVMHTDNAAILRRQHFVLIVGSKIRQRNDNLRKTLPSSNKHHSRWSNRSSPPRIVLILAKEQVPGMSLRVWGWGNIIRRSKYRFNCLDS